MSDKLTTFTADHLRTHDFDWYAALQFAPVEHRPGLLALFAFLAEIARIRGLVSDPMPGEIRLQWWRDALAGVGHGTVTDNPLAAALFEAMERYRLPAEPLMALLDARTFDLYDDAMPDAVSFEGYAGEVWSGPMALAMTILTGETPARFADAAGHAGVALAATRALADLPVWAKRGQCYLPADTMRRHGLDRSALASAKPSPELRQALHDFAAFARRHLDRASEAARHVPAESLPILLPAALARRTLGRVDRWAADPFAQPLPLAKWRRLYVLWRASKQMPRF